MIKVDTIGSADYLYVLAADSIAARIMASEITGRLPAEPDLAAELGVSYQAMRHAMRVLRKRGVIITRRGWGTFVASTVGDDGRSGSR